jgi:2-dehydropantoate 2-reductase
VGITIDEAWADDARAIVFGCGGIGGTVAAKLHRGGRHVAVVTQNAAITEAVGTRGLVAHTPEGVIEARVPVVTRAAALPTAPFDIALLAVPPNRIEEAAREALPHLAPHGLLVPLANGLPEERLASVFGAERVVGAIVGFGGSMRGPGEVEQTSEGSLVIGRLGGDIDEGARRVSAFLHPVDGRGYRTGVGETNLTTNLRGARWSKLAINCAISSLGTLGGDRLGSLMRHRFVRRLFLEVISEATLVALKSNVQLEKVSGTIDLEWLALTDEERAVAGSASLVAKHTVMLAVGARFRRLRSSMLAALERGREPPVDYLNGEVVAAGVRLGVPTPVNAAVVEAVHALARKERQPALARLEDLFHQTRTPDARAAA